MIDTEEKNEYELNNFELFFSTKVFDFMKSTDFCF